MAETKCVDASPSEREGGYSPKSAVLVCAGPTWVNR